jgi:hypothetical protein
MGELFLMAERWLPVCLQNGIEMASKVGRKSEYASFSS